MHVVGRFLLFKTSLIQMDPPAYDAKALGSTPHPRSIRELRAQIIANGSVMRTHNNGSGAHSDDHIELIVAKTPAFAASQQHQAARSTHWSEKHAGDEINSFKSTLPTAKKPSSPSSSAHDGKHYAVLVRRNTSTKTVKIIVKGEPKDTVEEALEWMLERTEMTLHDLVVRFGKPDEEGCLVM